MNEKYENARLLAIEGLEKALIAHKNDDVYSIDEGLDEFDAEIPRDEIEPISLLMLTLEYLVWLG